jgi:DNA uptake protein ComE-like DNA-binding protein
MIRRISIFFAVFILSAAVISTAAFGQAQKDEDAVQAPVEKLDINTATKAQLMKLPGITEALSQRIIAARPYASKSDLIEKKIVPNATYAGITDLIVAMPAHSAPSGGR